MALDVTDVGALGRAEEAVLAEQGRIEVLVKTSGAVTPELAALPSTRSDPD